MSGQADTHKSDGVGRFSSPFALLSGSLLPVQRLTDGLGSVLGGESPLDHVGHEGHPGFVYAASVLLDLRNGDWL